MPTTPASAISFRPCYLALAALVALWSLAASAQEGEEPATGRFRSTADHTKFEELQGKFKSGSEVVEKCIGCHNRAPSQLLKTKHWNWEFDNHGSEKKLGKKNVLNNFFISPWSNLPYCAVCHISNGWKNNRFDFADASKVDCLVCHDTTGVYTLKKFHLEGDYCEDCHDIDPKSSIGNVRIPPDYTEIAQKVGPTSRQNCGACHFRDGGNGVKHGDLDSSLENPGKALDVHMDSEGLNFQCTTCHNTDQHAVRGSRYAPTAFDRQGIHVSEGSRATCESCHGETPHVDNDKMNDHTDRVACQTCHIPTFARGGNSTKMYWDWSTAGRRQENGRQIVELDDKDRVTYSTNRGDAVWAENVVPEYIWFNGQVDFTVLGQIIDPSGTVPINAFGGSPDDPDSRIWPVKVSRGKQPYDVENKTLAVVKWYGKEKDKKAYWRNYDWDKAIAAGMKAAGLPYSGKFDFVETEMLWPIEHMVAPAEDAVACDSCHSRDGRLAGLSGFYMPGRDTYPWLTLAGWGAVLATLAGVFVHMSLRIAVALGRRNNR